MTAPAPKAAIPAPPGLAHPEPLSAGAAPAECSGTLPVLDSEALLQGQVAVLIAHLGQHYRLQATRQGKLILTK